MLTTVMRSSSCACDRAELGATIILKRIDLNMEELDVHPPPVRPAELAGTLWARSRAQTGNRQPADSSPAPESELAALCAWLEAQGLVEGWPPLAQAAAAV